MEIETEISRGERRSIGGLFDIEHHHRGLVTLALEEEDVRLVGAERDGIGDAIERHFVEIDRDVLGDAIEPNGLSVRAGTECEQRENRSADSNRDVEEHRHGASVARAIGGSGKAGRSARKCAPKRGGQSPRPGNGGGIGGDAIVDDRSKTE